MKNIAFGSEIEKTDASHAGGVSMTDAATDLLRDRILDLTLEPGERLEEKMLLARFGLSRTPVREAINRLISEGLVRVRGNRGVYVSPMDIEGILSLLDAYVLCERMVASVCKLDSPELADDLKGIQHSLVGAADRMDLLKVTEINARFHGRIAEAVENRFIQRYSADLHNLARRASFFVYRREAKKKDGSSVLGERVLPDHEKIIDHIANEDRDQLIVAVTEHALLFREQFEKMLRGPDFMAVEFRSTDTR